MKTFFTVILTSLLMAFHVSAESSGSWTKKAERVKGTWKIADGKLRLYDLSTKKGPDLKIFLSPKSVGELTGKNAAKGGKFIAKLKSHKGSQSYSLPSGIKLSDYKSVLILCEEYSKLWGAASL